MPKVNYRPTIARRNSCGDAKRRCYFAHVRMSREISKRLASVQGLCYAHGQKESLADLFEHVCMPAISRYVERYARAARGGKRHG